MVIIWISWSIPRVRADQVLKIGWNRLIPLALLTILGAAVFKTMGWF
jgi:NADH-quinone oxidoreductase subunit H